MNPVNLGTMEQTGVGSGNQQNIDGRNASSKLKEMKDEKQSFAEADYGYTDPKTETFVEQHYSPLLRLPMKRPKIENMEYDYMNTAYYVAQEKEDDCDAFGRCVSAQLRCMAHMQKFLAQRLISEVCFRGQIQALQLTTGLSVQPTMFQQLQQQPVYTPRSAHYGQGSEYLIAHQQGQTHIPMNLNAASAVHHQNFMNMQQQTELAAATMNHTANVTPSKKIP